jgi:hypothetical protein
MTLGPNPLHAEAARKALVENDGQAAFDATANASRAALDAQELREIERSQYYGATSLTKDPGTETVPATPTARRSLIARLFRRG